MRGVRASALFVAFTVSATAFAGRSVDFPYEDVDYLCEGQQKGGRVFVPGGVPVSSPLPLVVFLHGLNPGGPLHRWMGGGGDDLRKLVDAWVADQRIVPLAIAAPSQTSRAGSSSTLWADFDLGRFVDATERALGGKAPIDRSRIVVAGHSGAGCNRSGGLLKVAKSRAITPLSIVAIDTCLDANVGEALAQAADATRIAVYWQSATWNRKVTDFEMGFQATRGDAPLTDDVFEEMEPVGPAPHDAVVAPSLLAALTAVLGQENDAGP